MREILLLIVSVVVAQISITEVSPNARIERPVTIKLSTNTLSVTDSVRCTFQIPTSCLDLRNYGFNVSGVYRMDADGTGSVSAFNAYCDMTSEGGGWNICYTTDGLTPTVINSQITSTTSFPSNGYRSDCRYLEYGEIMYINHATNQRAFFRRNTVANSKFSLTGYSTSGSSLGLFSSFGSSVANPSLTYQVNVCGSTTSADYQVGLMVSQYTNCWKTCSSWCSDTNPNYFRVQGDFTQNRFKGNAFNENGHANVANKRISVGLRRRSSTSAAISAASRTVTGFVSGPNEIQCTVPKYATNLLGTTLRVSVTVNSVALSNTALVPLLTFTCFGVDYFSTGVCSNAGSCVAQDRCVCNVGFFGTRCEQASTTCNSFADIALWLQGNGNTLDSSRYRVSATASGSTFAYVPGVRGQAFRFNHPSSLSDVVSVPNFRLPITYTACMFTQFTGSVTTATMYMHTISSTNYNFFQMRSTRTRLSHHYYASTTRSAYYSSALPLNTWYHLCTRRSGNTFTGFHNGRVLFTATETSTAYASSTGRLLLGQYSTSQTGSFSTSRVLRGSIDEFMLFGRALSNNEITALAANQSYCCGITSGNDRVCNGRGTCLYPLSSDCQCLPGFTGSRCEFEACYGVPISDSRVCSGRGTCFNGTCNCVVGWRGSMDCSAATCFGISAQNSSVCSGHGLCNTPNNCSCLTNYTGASCQNYFCHGINATNLNVCSGRGRCVAHNQCNCNLGWGGQQCNLPVCYGFDANSTQVCNRRNGTCIGHNQCSCSPGYTGIDCSIPLCSGIAANNTNVCSRNGTCVAPNTCICRTNYAGNNCQFPICSGIPASSSSACSGNGTCVKANTCSCNPGYYGNQCQLYSCFGIRMNSGLACSGRGRCIAPDTCACRTGYSSHNCSSFTCNGFPSSDPVACQNTAGGFCSNCTCIDFDTCSCPNGNAGEQCTFPICYGIPSSDDRVCSMRQGTCIGKDNCDCLPGYSGVTCNTIICNGVPDNAQNVCSGHGTCTGPNQCVCDPGYFGNNCEMYECYDIRFNNDTVCGGHGICSKPDSCICQPGFITDDCSLTSCYGKLSNDPSVCGDMKGRCSSLNNCTCEPGFAGQECTIPVCYEYEPSDPRVCGNGNGTCEGPNNCICNPGYSGVDCSFPVCYDISSQETTAVCSGHGLCSSPDRCICASGFTGHQCEVFSCYGIDWQDSAVCSGQGTCDGPNLCQCNYGYGGFRCEMRTCNGIFANSSLVCNTRGSCTGPNTCTCNTGYGAESFCRSPLCNEIDGSNPNVCSGHGACTSPDVCTCATGFQGADCEDMLCFGISATDDAVCSGNGACTDVNTCICDPGFGGSTCSQNIAIIYCQDVLSTNPSVCSGHGTCVSTDSCNCAAGWTGTSCNIPSCYGISAATPSVCSGNGNCTNINTCVCRSGKTGAACNVDTCFDISSNNASVCSGHGSCVAENNCSCALGYAGIDCSITTCYGFAASDESVCSNNGQCVGPNTCNCDMGYTGFDCKFYLCNGIASNNASVCSGRGSCIAYDFCNCTRPYFGSNCQNMTVIVVDNVQNRTNITSNSTMNSNGTITNTTQTSNNTNVNSTTFNNQTVTANSTTTNTTAIQNSTITNNQTIVANNTVTNSTGIQNDTITNNSTMGNSTINNSTIVPTNSSMNSSIIANNSLPSNSSIPHNETALSNSTIGNITSNTNTSLTSNTTMNSTATTNSTVNTTNNTTVANSTLANNQSAIVNSTGTNSTTSANSTITNSTMNSNATANVNSTIANNTVSSSNYTLNNATVPSNTTQGIGNNTVLNNGTSLHNHTVISNSTGMQNTTGSSNSSIANSTVISNNQTLGNSSLNVNITRNSTIVNNSTTNSNTTISNTTQVNNHTITTNSTVTNTTRTQNSTNNPVPTPPIIRCHGLPRNNTSVCSGHGICISNNNCSCYAGYSGLNCAIFSCFGFAAQDARVCSGRGSCAALDNCRCALGYIGSQCTQFTCFGMNASTANCNNGICIGVDTCLCRPGYTGQRCNIPICYGRAATDRQVCNGRGTCVMPNTCQCRNSTGLMCDQILCFGLRQTDTAVCSGHGTCTGMDSCTCSSGYTGTSCSTPTCYGLLATDNSVCGGQGTCTAPNKCSCYGPNRNELCTSCLPSFTGPNCTQQVCDDALVCNSNGKCTSSLTCDCFNSRTTGYWAGQFCSTCASNYYGPRCDQFCSNNIQCSGHGVCAFSAGTASCTCSQNAASGYWQGSSCSVCSPPYMGATCRTMITNFTVARTGDRMTATFVYDRRSGRRIISCSSIFTSSTLDKLGNNPTCSWTDALSDTFEVLFGTQATIMPGTSFDFNWSPLTLPRTNIRLMLHGNTIDAPVADLRLPTTSVICDNIVVDASRSSSADRRALSFEWSTNAVANSALHQYVSNQREPLVTIPSELMDSGVSYQISVRTMNAFGTVSTTATVTIAKSLIAVPLALINAPSTVTTTQAAKNFRVTASIRRPSCEYMSTSDISMVWLQTAGLPVRFSQRNGTLTILSFEPSQTDYTVTFAFRAFKTADPSIGSQAFVNIRAEQIDLVARIAGGTRRSVQNTRAFTLDGSSSYDPMGPGNATYAWSCEVASTRKSCDLDSGILTESRLLIPENALEPGVYRFTLTYIKDVRSSTTFIDITVLPRPVVPTTQVIQIFTPETSIIECPQEVAVTDSRFAIKALARIAQQAVAINRFSYSWSAYDESEDITNDIVSSLALPSTNTLIVQPSRMQEGHVYLFVVNATYINTNGVRTMSSAASRVQCSSPVQPGTLSISPENGIAMRTMFTLTASQFESRHLPLEYSFRYTDSNGAVVPISTTSQANTLNTLLPPGNHANNYSITISVTVRDAKQTTATVSKTIVVELPFNFTIRSSANSTNVSVSSAPKVNFGDLLDAMYNERTGLFIKRESDAYFTSTTNDMANLITKASIVLDIANMDVEQGRRRLTSLSSDDCPDPTIVKCPNNCSDAGICINGVCKCNEGRNGTDCRLTDEDMANKEYIRSSILKFLWDSIMVQLDNGIVDETMLVQLGSLCEKLTLSTDELSSETQRLMITLINELTDSTKLSESVLSILIRSVSNIAQRKSSIEFETLIHPLTERLMTKLNGLLIAGDKPMRYVDQTISSVVQRTYRDGLGNMKVKLCMFEKEQSSIIRLPSIFSNLDRDTNETSSLLGIEIPSEVSLKVIAIKQIQYPNTAPNMTSDVVRFELTTLNGSVIRLRELIEPIQIAVPVKDISMFRANFSQVQWKCKYWNTTDLKWKDNGCLVDYVNEANGTIHCICNHTTDFAVFLDPYTPPAPTETKPQEPVISVVSSIIYAVTLPVTLSVAVVFVVYLILVSIGLLSATLARASRAESYNKYEVVTGKSLCFRKLLISFIQSNPLFGFCSYYITNSPKLSVFSQTSLLYMGVLVMMLLNMFFQNLSSFNYDLILQSLLISMASSFVYRGLGYAYSKVTPIKGCKVHPEYEDANSPRSTPPYKIIVILLGFFASLSCLIFALVSGAMAAVYYSALGNTMIVLGIMFMGISFVFFVFATASTLKRLLKWEYEYPRLLGIPLLLVYAIITVASMAVIIYFGLQLTWAQAWNCLYAFAISIVFDQLIISCVLFFILSIVACLRTGYKTFTNRVQQYEEKDQTSSPIYVTSMNE